MGDVKTFEQGRRIAFLRERCGRDCRFLDAPNPNAAVVANSSGNDRSARGPHSLLLVRCKIIEVQLLERQLFAQ